MINPREIVEAEPPAETAESADPPAIPGTLGMDLEEFTAEWNTANSELGSSLSLPVLTASTDGIQGVAEHYFSDNLAFLISVNHADGSVRDAVLLGQGPSLKLGGSPHELGDHDRGG